MAPRGRSCCALLMAVARHSHALRLAGEGGVPDNINLARDTPDFLACDTPTPCGPESMQLLFMGDVLKSGYMRARDVAAAGRNPRIVHVGADGLANGARWTDVHLYSEVFSHIDLPPGVFRMDFVEPIAMKGPRFWMNIGRLPVNVSQVRLYTALINGRCESPMGTLYSISRRAGRRFNFDINTVLGWSSTLRGRLLNTLKHYARSNPFIHCYHSSDGNCIEGLRAFADHPNASTFFEETQVPCFTLDQLLNTMGRSEEDVAMLIIDAEGLDATILEPMLEGHPDFAPGFIMLEGSMTSIPGILPLLRRHGYMVGEKPGSHGNYAAGDSENIIAVPAGVNLTNFTATLPEAT